MSNKFPKSNVIIDTNSGNGTAQSLLTTFPWKSQKSFVCEGDIFFDSSLIKEMVDQLESNSKLKVIVSATDKIDIAPTHRQIIFSPNFKIIEKGKGSEPVEYRNLGVYIVDEVVENHIHSGSETLVDVYRNMHNSGLGVNGVIYRGDYLHMAYREDIGKWEEYFKNEK